MNNKMIYNLHLPIYHAGSDMLYDTLNDGVLDCAYEIEDIDGVTLMWSKEGKLQGIEIYDFKAHYPELPATVEVKSAKGDVTLVITRINDNFDEKNIEALRSKTIEDMPTTAWRPKEPGWCAKSPKLHITDESRRICAEALVR